MTKRFHVVVSSAKMPGKVRAPYVHVAVIETTGGYVPKRIDTRPTAVVRVVKEWRRQHLGYNPSGNTAGRRAVVEAEELAAAMNAQCEAVAAAQLDTVSP